MHKSAGLKALLFCLVFCKLVFAGSADISISHISSSVCKMQANKQKVSLEGGSIRVMLPPKRVASVNNKCNFAVISRKKRYVEISGVRVSSVFGCKNQGDSCSIILNPPKPVQVVTSTRQEQVGVKNAANKAQTAVMAEKPHRQPTAISGKDRLTIAIDAGHGGKDPGATGRKGTKEKDITLKYALFIASDLKKAGYRVLLTRTNDTFIELHKRVEYAMGEQADLFISIHADSAPNPNARGATVYMLSPSAINRVSHKHQANGNFVNTHDDDLNFNILNLLQSSNVKQSHAFSVMLVEKMRGHDIRLTMAPVRSAEFAVLKAPTFPAVLLEVGYISNLEDEDMMHQRSYMMRVSASIRDAIKESHK